MAAFIDRLRTAPPVPEIADQHVIEKTYAKWRIRVFYSMYVGYALYYLTRQSFTFAMPSLMQDLGYDKGQLGLLASIFALTYGVSKFVSGMLGDKVNPRYLMGLGLFSPVKITRIFLCPKISHNLAMCSKGQFLVGHFREADIFNPTKTWEPPNHSPSNSSCA